MALASVAIRDTAGQLRQLPRSGIIRAARRVKDLADDEARRATGDGTMSGFGRRGAKLRARDTITGSGAYVFCTVRGLPAGPWAILNDGANPHVIRPRRRRGRGRRGALGVSGFGVYASVSHPGSRAKGTWRRVRTRAERVIPAMFADDVSRIVG